MNKTEAQCYDFIIALARELEADFATQYETMEAFARWNLPEEIALEWLDAEGMLQTIKMLQYRSQEEIALIELIMRNFDTAFQQTQNPVWTYSAMQNDVFWHQQRHLARKLIDMAENRNPILRLGTGQEIE
ncbi:MAG: hypothetical protein E7464_01175 [Ruminococcaceae bacterium]|nr:hypothetical protein [Oscillospiraceae bacterium]